MWCFVFQLSASVQPIATYHRDEAGPGQHACDVHRIEIGSGRCSAIKALLALVTVKAVVVGLSLGSLSPLAARGLLATTIAPGALRSAVAHGLSTVPSRGLGSGAREIAWLAAVLAYIIHMLDWALESRTESVTYRRTGGSMP